MECAMTYLATNYTLRVVQQTRGVQQLHRGHKWHVTVAIVPDWKITQTYYLLCGWKNVNIQSSMWCGKGWLQLVIAVLLSLLITLYSWAQPSLTAGFRECVWYDCLHAQAIALWWHCACLTVSIVIVIELTEEHVRLELYSWRGMKDAQGLQSLCGMTCVILDGFI